MKAIAVYPGKPNSVHLEDIPKPSVGDVAGGKGVLVRELKVGVDATDREINIDWVLGNKLLLGSVNANREHFESGIRDLALGEVMYPQVTEKILTNPVDGLDNDGEMMRLLVEEKTALKVYVNVAEE